MTNAISAHKDELEKLLEDLSGDIAVSGITFVAVVDAYIARLDANSSGIRASVNPPPAQIDGGLTYGTNIDPKLRAYYAQHTNSERRAAARKQAVDTHRRLTRDERFRRLPLFGESWR